MKKKYLGIIIVFYILLSLPLLQQNILFIPEYQLTENRILESFPNISLKDLDTFPKRFESYFNDHFGFRPTLVRLNSIIKVFVFRNTHVGDVIIGKDNWLFFNYGLGSNKSKITELVSLWDSFSNKSRVRFEELDKYGISYVEIIAPNKNSLYPEYLPKQTSSNYYSDILQKIIESKVPYRINLYDVFKGVMKSDASKTVYYKTDTHWNRYGAYYVYREIMKKLYDEKGQIQYLKESDLEFKNVPSNGYDLAKMLELDDYFRDIDVVVKRESVSTNQKIIKNGILIIFGDSFFEKKQDWTPVQFLSNHFEKVIMFHSYDVFDAKAIVQMKPEAVIFEIAERSIFAD
jgi:hypothetical protein